MFKEILALFKKPKLPPKQGIKEPAMTDEERNVIYVFASGYHPLRDSAIRIHRKYLGTSYMKTLEFKFMSEIDNVSPDLALRAMFRQELLDSRKDFTNLDKNPK